MYILQLWHTANYWTSQAYTFNCCDKWQTGSSEYPCLVSNWLNSFSLSSGQRFTGSVFDESSLKFGISSSTESIVGVTIFSSDALTKKPVASLKDSLSSQFHWMPRHPKLLSFRMGCEVPLFLLGHTLEVDQSLSVKASGYLTFSCPSRESEQSWMVSSATEKRDRDREEEERKRGKEKEKKGEKEKEMYHRNWRETD